MSPAPTPTTASDPATNGEVQLCAMADAIRCLEAFTVFAVQFRYDADPDRWGWIAPTGCAEPSSWLSL